MRFYFAILAALMLAARLPAADDSSSVPVVSIRQVRNVPVIDGVPDDKCWRKAEKITAFTESYRGGPATEQTEAMLLRDGVRLYVAFICHDSQPAQIRAAQTQRNSEFSDDDYVGILIDPQRTHIDHYHFEVNPVGTQRETIPDGSASNITWRGDWLAAAHITDTGWTAEMAIPFDILKYPKGATSFSFSFRRRIPRLDERSEWPSLGANMDQTRFADMVDLQLPRRNNGPVLMPYTVTSSEPERSVTDYGFDLKHELSSNSTAMLTYNPDFTDVQDAVASISYSYTERYLPERRPFFQEASSFFSDSTAFYSRRIEDMDWGIKSFGRSGGSSYAVLNALKKGESNHFAAIYSRDFDPDTSFAFYATGSGVRDAFKSDPSEPDTSMCISPGGYKSWRTKDAVTTLSMRHYRAINSGSQPDGFANKIALSRSTSPRHVGYSLAYKDTDSGYYVRDAYVPLPGVRGITADIGFHDRPARGKFTYWKVSVETGRHWSEDDSLHHDRTAFHLNCSTRNEWGLGATLASGSWLGEPDSTAKFTLEWLKRHLYGGGRISLASGKRSGEDYREVSLSQSFRFWNRFVLSLGYEWTRLAASTGPESDTQMTLLANYDITPEKSLGVWIVGRGSDTNMCLTYRQTVRSGLDAYLVSGYPNTRTTQDRIALKLVMPMTL